MKTFLVSLLLAAAFAAPATANNVLIYKVVTSSSYVDYFVDDPTLSTAKGTGPFASTNSHTEYYVIDLDAPSSSGPKGQWVGFSTYTDTVAGPAVDNKNVAITSKKFMSIPDITFASDLSFLLAAPQPLKGAGNFLWNTQSGFAGGGDNDNDSNGVIDTKFRGFRATQGKGTATPLVLTPTLTIPNVARTFVEKTVGTSTYEDLAGSPGNYPPYKNWYKTLETSTWTLDTVLTKLANTATTIGTADIPLTGTLSAGSLANAVQRVHDLLYSQGYRKDTSGGSGS